MPAGGSDLSSAVLITRGRSGAGLPRRTAIRGPRHRPAFLQRAVGHRGCCPQRQCSYLSTFRLARTAMQWRRGCRGRSGRRHAARADGLRRAFNDQAGGSHPYCHRPCGRRRGAAARRQRGAPRGRERRGADSCNSARGRGSGSRGAAGLCTKGGGEEAMVFSTGPTTSGAVMPSTPELARSEALIADSDAAAAAVAAGEGTAQGAFYL